MQGGTHWLRFGPMIVWGCQRYVFWFDFISIFVVRGCSCDKLLTLSLCPPNRDLAFLVGLSDLVPQRKDNVLDLLSAHQGIGAA